MIEGGGDDGSGEHRPFNAAPERAAGVRGDRAEHSRGASQREAVDGIDGVLREARRWSAKVIAAVGIIPVPLYFLGRDENVFPVLPALRIDLAVDRFDFGRVAVRIVATAERRIIRHVPRRIKPLMQRPILSGMVAMSGLTFLRMDERCQQASARKEELAKKVQGAVSLLMGALYEGKIVSNNVKRRHLNSGQRAMAVAMM
jgi:hypothetical protein